MKWYNGTIIPYNTNSKNLTNYCVEVMQKIAKKANNQPICCVDFIARRHCKSKIIISSSKN